MRTKYDWLFRDNEIKEAKVDTERDKQEKLWIELGEVFIKSHWGFDEAFRELEGVLKRNGYVHTCHSPSNPHADSNHEQIGSVKAAHEVRT